MTRMGTILLAAGLLPALGGCVLAPPAPPPPLPLVAMPGPAKTAAEFRQDDTACRAAAVPLPPAPGRSTGGATAAAPPGSSAAARDEKTANASAPPTPAATYLRCMEARNNTVTPIAPPQPVGYAYGYGYYPSVFGPYAALDGYPWQYDGYLGFGYAPGCCLYRGYYGRHFR